MRRFLPLAVVLVALAARFFWLDHQSLWGDEGHTWQAIRDSLPQTLERVRTEGSQAPLFFVGQWAWSQLFGAGELGLRSFSALAGAAGVWFVWLIGERLRGGRAGWWAATLAALSPLWVYYSQEARPYALSATLAAGAMACALRAVEEHHLRRGWLTGYILCAAGAALTHYLAFFAVLATALAVPRTRFALAVWLGATVLAILPVLAWIGIGWTSFVETAVSSGSRGLGLWAYLAGVSEAFANGLPSPTGLPTAMLALGVAVAFIGVGGRGGLLLAGWLALVLAGAELVGFPSDRPGPWARYVISALPAFIVLEGAGIERLGKLNLGAGAVALVALLGVNLFSLSHVYSDPALARFDFRTPVRQLAATVTPQDRVIVNQGNPAFFYYYGNTKPEPIMLVPRPPIPSDEEIRQMVAEAASGARRVYLVKYMPPDYDPNGQIESWLNAHAVKTSDEWVEHIRLIGYDLVPSVRLEDSEVHWLNARLDDAIELLGWSLEPETRAGMPTRITLFWRATGPVSTDFKVFVHVVAADDPERKVTQHDSIPGLGTRPTIQWQPGVVVTDVHPLTLPAGDWLLAVGMYDPVSGQRPVVRLPEKPDDSRVLLGPFSVR